MRLMDGMRLRIKDVDFERQVIIVREAKGAKDRVVMLPRSLAPALRLQMLAARAQWEADRQAQRGGGWKRHMRWNKNIRRWAIRGLGSGCFPRPRFLLIRAVAWSAATTCLKSGSNAP